MINRLLNLARQYLRPKCAHHSAYPILVGEEQLGPVGAVVTIRVVCRGCMRELGRPQSGQASSVKAINGAVQVYLDARPPWMPSKEFIRQAFQEDQWQRREFGYSLGRRPIPRCVRLLNVRRREAGG